MDLEQLEAELEQDLERLEAADENDLLSDLVQEVQSGLVDDTYTAYDINCLEGFALFAESKSAVDSSLQNSLAIVQDINKVLVESNTDGSTFVDSRGSPTEPLQTVKLEQLYEETHVINVHASSADVIEDQVSLDISESIEKTSAIEIELPLACAIEDQVSLASLHWPDDVISGSTTCSSQKNHLVDYKEEYHLETLLGRAADDAKQDAHLAEEKHRLRKLKLDKRQEQRGLNRFARVIQAWYQRLLFRREYMHSMIIDVSLTVVHDILHRCTKSFEVAAMTKQIIAAPRGLDERDMSLHHALVIKSSQTICRIYRFIIVLKDTKDDRLHVFIMCHGKLQLFTVYLTKRAMYTILHESELLRLPGCIQTGVAQLLRHTSSTSDRRSYRLNNTVTPKFSRSTLALRQFASEHANSLSHCDVALFMGRGDADQRSSIPLAPASTSSDHCICCLRSIRRTHLYATNRNIFAAAAQSMCWTIKQVLMRWALRALKCLNAAVRIQATCRRFLVQRRIKSVQCNAFEYDDDDELQSILCTNLADLVHFDNENDLDSKALSWQPCRPLVTEVSSYPRQCGKAISTDDTSIHSVLVDDTVTLLKVYKEANTQRESRGTSSKSKLKSDWQIKDARVAQVSTST